MVLKKYTYYFLLLLFSFSARAQLVINEVSQGYTGNQEYVELLVVGTPTCNAIPCMDLRGYLIDDNNGNHATGSGVGIAQGCVRFTTDALWSCVPVGTLILIYNDADLNPDVPAADLSLTDGNCRLVIPISNCTLFERNTSTPSTATATYPTTGFVSCGNWTQLGMANNGDSFQTVDPSGNQIFSVSWGNNSVADIIYFAAGQGGLVCSMTNSTSNNPSTQANWVSVAVAGNQTPGSPNNAANAAWINSMNNSCTALTPLVANATSTDAGCTCTGSATVTASGAIGPYTYAWAPSGGTSATASSLCPGIYTVTVTSSNGCTQTATVSIAYVSPVTATITASNVSCNGGSNGSATVTASNTTGAISYSWTPTGGNSSNASGLSAGNYTVNILDGGGCAATQTINITQPPTLSVVPSQTNVLCNAGSTGSASVSASGGTGAYTYTWSPSGGNNTSANALSAGNYSCTISDANACSILQSFTITEPTVLQITPSQTNVACNGSNTGTASALVSGGTTGYTYTWSPSGGNASLANGLPAGNYTVNVTDANGCAQSQSYMITQPGAFAVTATQTNVACNGGNTGAASVAVTGATGAYSYTWSPTGGSFSSASGLSAGNYSVNVADGNGCITTQSFIITEPPALSVIATQTNVSCNGGSNGIASVNPSGGTGAYTYTWSPSGGNTSSANALPAGNYSVMVNDANGCTLTQSFIISEPAPLSITPTQTNVLCNGTNSGSASAAVNGGTPGYTYAWTPVGGNSSSASNLSAGTYTIDVNDANGCSLSQSFTITEPPALTLTINSTQATCHNNNGSANAMVAGGTGAYTYSWSPAGGNAATASALAPGNYTLNVNDANGCAITTTTSISNIGGATATVSNTSVSCNGGSDGSATVTATGGAGTYTYSWVPSGGNSTIASGLNAGNYTVTVTDSIGCITTTTTNVAQPTVLSAGIISTSVSCFGGNNGTASTVFVTGGTGAYTYMWSNGSTNSSITGLSAGNYSVVVTDVNGCTVSTSTTVAQPTQLTVSAITTSVSCNAGTNGSASANVNGGIGAYTYTWQPSGGNASTANNLIAGTYTVNVSDANGCTQSTTATVVQPTSLTVSISNTPVTCGTSNGTASANVSGGSAPYTYSWSPTGGTSSNANNLSAITYTVYVTDNNGCIQPATTTIANAATLSVTATASPALCNGAASGSATVNVSGGSTPYSYLWSAGAGSAAAASNLTAGSYTVAVTDNNNCTLTTTVTVTQPPALTLTVSSITVCSGQTATLTANASGGTPAYMYVWNAGSPIASNTFAFTPATSTVYTVSIRDANNCTSGNINANISVLPPLQVNTGDILICAGANGTLSATASGGNGNYSYSWMPGNLTGSSVSVSAQAPTIYTVTVSDGCTVGSASDTGLVSVISVPTVTLLPIISGCVPLCVDFTVGSTATITGYQWNFGDNFSSAQQSPTHCYNTAGVFNVGLTYTTSQGCSNTVTSNGMVHAFAKPHAAFAASAYETTMLDPQISFYDQSTSNISSWNWNLGDGTITTQQNPVHSYTSSGDYPVFLTVTNQQGCKDSIMIEIRVKEDFTFFAPNAFTPDGDDDNEVFLPRGIGWDNTTFKLRIYDRWGNLVSSTSDVTQGWDGTRHGVSVQQDVYVWEAELNDLYGALHKYSGTVSLVR